MPEKPRIASQLLRFIEAELLDEPYDQGDPLEAGAVDSLGLEQLVDFAEREYGVRIADEEMVRENFESVAALAALIESKLDAAGP
jgi:acyl carrier protein